jgi:hypothetical protein
VDSIRRWLKSLHERATPEQWAQLTKLLEDVKARGKVIAGALASDGPSNKKDETQAAGPIPTHGSPPLVKAGGGEDLKAPATAGGGQQ